MIYLIQVINHFLIIIFICNGEIYNHKFLKEKYNIKTNSDSDCEVILYLYQKLGFEKTCNDLDGVFSLIIYDTNTNKIYVGRDPYGVRPLFIGYNEHNNIFLSSELKSIHDLTIYTKQFTPGYYLEYDLINKTSIHKNYYDFNFKRELKYIIFYKMKELSVEHVLLFVVATFLLYYLMGSCGCSRDGFSVSRQNNNLTPQQKQQKYCENELNKCYCISGRQKDCVKSTDTKTTVPFIKTEYNPDSICGGVNYNPTVNGNSCGKITT